MPVIRAMVRFLGGAAVLLLLVRFVLEIFYPGTAETQGVFQAIALGWPWLTQVTNVLVAPLVLLNQWVVMPFLPATLHGWFPLAGAAQVMGVFAKLVLLIPGLSQTPVGAHLLAMDYAQHYPGKIHWLVLLSIPLWSFLQLAVELVGAYWEESLDGPPAPPKKSLYTAGQGLQMAVPGPTTLYNPSAPQSPGQDAQLRAMLQSLKQENIQLQVQKQDLRATFSQYVSPNVLRYIEQNRDSLHQRVNQTQQVTVLFADIRGFTSFTQTHSGDAVAQFLSDYFALVNDVILNQYDGTISKLMGDGVMAYWGFPVPNPDHAFVATRAAMAILQALQQWNQDPTRTPIHVGIGLCSGEVTIGNVGSKDFMDFTLIGDPVNLASRLQSLNKELNTQLLISESTFLGLQNRILCQDRGFAEIRGWDGTVHVFEPLG